METAKLKVDPGAAAIVVPVDADGHCLRIRLSRQMWEALLPLLKGVSVEFRNERASLS